MGDDFYEDQEEFVEEKRARVRSQLRVE